MKVKIYIGCDVNTENIYIGSNCNIYLDSSLNYITKNNIDVVDPLIRLNKGGVTKAGCDIEIETNNLISDYIKTNGIKWVIKSNSGTEYDIATSNDLVNYTTTSAMNTKFNNYTTTSAMNKKFNNYTTTSAMNTKFNNYTTTSAMNTKFNNYTTTSAMNTKFNDYETIFYVNSLNNNINLQNQLITISGVSINLQTQINTVNTKTVLSNYIC